MQFRWWITSPLASVLITSIQPPYNSLFYIVRSRDRSRDRERERERERERLWACRVELFFVLYSVIASHLRFFRGLVLIFYTISYRSSTAHTTAVCTQNQPHASISNAELNNFYCLHLETHQHSRLNLFLTYIYLHRLMLHVPYYNPAQ